MYKQARLYMNHTPILQVSKESGLVTVVPLCFFPNPKVTNLSSVFMDDNLAHLINAPSLLEDIYQCNVLPTTRKPIRNYPGPMLKSGVLVPVFGVLNFTLHPLTVQPKLCLVNWLRARNIDVRMEDDRKTITQLVRNSLRVNKQIQAPALQPVEGAHNGFSSICARTAGNEFNVWCRKYLIVAKNVQPVSNDIIDRLLGPIRKTRPSIRRRVANLARGGHYDT